MPPIKNIHFSFPCKEDINEMKPCDQGRQCLLCSHTVIDFRNKSQEDLNALKRNNKDVCGIFSEKQVAKGYGNYRQLVTTTLLAMGLSAFSPEANAQEEADPFRPILNTSTKEHIIAGVVTVEAPTPEYPGGIKAMRSFFAENLVYPSDSVEGKVYVSLTVDTLGLVKNVRIKKSLSPLADAEVVRVVKLMIFKPALVNGKPINSNISLPVSFSLNRKK